MEGGAPQFGAAGVPRQEQAPRSIYAPPDQAKHENREIFDIRLWGVVYCCIDLLKETETEELWYDVSN